MFKDTYNVTQIHTNQFCTFFFPKIFICPGLFIDAEEVLYYAYVFWKTGIRLNDDWHKKWSTVPPNNFKYPLCYTHSPVEIIHTVDWWLAQQKWKRAITPKYGKAELRFLCNTRLNKLNEIYLHPKYLVNTFWSFTVILKDKKIWTDRHTDG